MNRFSDGANGWEVAAVKKGRGMQRKNGFYWRLSRQWALPCAASEYVFGRTFLVLSLSALSPRTVGSYLDHPALSILEHFYWFAPGTGPASKTNMIIEGDILQDVDGKSVVRRPLSEVSSLMLGPRGTQSDFGFVRKGQRFVVQITR
jgi:hypothetical protein